MAGFSYFFAHTREDKLVRAGQLDRKVLFAHALDAVLRDVERAPNHAIVTQVTRGPDDAAGVLLYPRGATDVPKLIGYHPDDQTWSRLGPTTWIGWLTDDPPSPLDLARRSQVVGYTVNDAAGRGWLIPAVRGNAHYPAPYGALPGEYVWEDSTPTLALAPEHAHIWRKSAKIWDHLVGADGTKLDDAWLVTAVLEALSMNYRIGPRELTTMQGMGLAVITSRNLPAYLHSLCDVTSVEEFLAAKKKDAAPSEAAGADSSTGSPAATATGTQPAVNSGSPA